MCVCVSVCMFGGKGGGGVCLSVCVKACHSLQSHTDV